MTKLKLCLTVLIHSRRAQERLIYLSVGQAEKLFPVHCFLSEAEQRVLIWPLSEVKQLDSTRPAKFPRNPGCP